MAYIPPYVTEFLEQSKKVEPAPITLPSSQQGAVSPQDILESVTPPPAEPGYVAPVKASVIPPAVTPPVTTKVVMLPDETGYLVPTVVPVEPPVVKPPVVTPPVVKPPVIEEIKPEPSIIGGGGGGGGGGVPAVTTPETSPIITPPEVIPIPKQDNIAINPEVAKKLGVYEGYLNMPLNMNDPQVARAVVGVILANPDQYTTAVKAQAIILEKFNYDLRGVTPAHIEQSFTPEEIDRYGLLPTAPHILYGMDNNGKLTQVNVTTEDYYKVMDLPALERLPTLIKWGVYPEGTKYISDLDAFNKEFGTNLTEPFAIPNIENYVTETVKREGATNQLENVGAITDGILDIDKAVKAGVAEQTIKDAGFGNAYQEYNQLVKDREVALQKLKDADVINENNNLDLDKAVRAGIVDVKRYYDAGYVVTIDDIKKIQLDIKQEQYYSDWTAKELLDGYRVKDGVYYEAPFGVKSGGLWRPAPQWAERKIIEAQNNAISELQPYIVTKEAPIYPPDIMDRIYAIKPDWEDTPPKNLLETVKVYDIVKMREDNIPEDKMKIVGLTDIDISNADQYILQQKGLDALKEKYEAMEQKLVPYTKYAINPEYDNKYSMRQTTPTYDVSKALKDKAITEQDLLDSGYTSEQINEMKVRADVGLKAYIPIYGTIALWSVSGGWEKGMQIVGDALLILPLAKVGATALKVADTALRVGIVEETTALMRVGQLAKNVVQMSEQSVIGMVKFPYQLIKAPIKTLGEMLQSTIFPFVHPIEAAKGMWALGTGKVFIGEPYLTRAVSLFTNVKAIPNAAIVLPTDGKGVQRLFINGGMTPDEALDATQKMQLMLSNMIANGEKVPNIVKVPVMENGVLKYTIEYHTSRAMRELGIVISGTPFAEPIMAGAAEPVSSKVYFSTTGTYDWTAATARGITTPEVVEMGRGGAIIKDMKINRFFDPVQKVYRNTIEMEMTVPEGKLLITRREEALTILKANGNARVFPSTVEDIIPQDRIVDAIRNAEGKVFKFKPINFEEIESIPKKSATWLKEYVRTHNMAMSGSAAERTWTDTIHIPKDADIHSLNNTARIDAPNLAKGISDTSGIQTRVQTPDMVGKDVYRVQRYNTDTKEWEQMFDILDEVSAISAWRDVKQYPYIDNNGIKMEHPLQQAEKMVNKLQDYVDGKIQLENHRGHAKRFAWISEKILDTSGGRLTKSDTEVLNKMATRVKYGEYGDISTKKLLKLKLGIMDEIVDKIAPRRIKIRLPDGSVVKTTCF